MEESLLDKLEVMDTSSLVDKVEKKIIDLIQKSGMKVGDTLPKELDLADKLGVSRTVIREALLRLRTMGLIDSKKKQGAILTNPDVLLPFRKIFHPSILNEETLKGIFEMRLALEVGMADFIVDKITDEDIEELERITSKARSDTDFFDVEEEIAFHGKLYQISKNSMLMELQELLIPVFQYVYNSGLLSEPRESSEFISHQGIVQVLKQKDAEKFRTAMRRHLNNHFVRILKS